jgi:hypothetical protein
MTVPAAPLPSAAMRLLAGSVVTMTESTTAGGVWSGVAVAVGGTATTGCGGAVIERMAGVAVATITPAPSRVCKPTA